MHIVIVGGGPAGAVAAVTLAGRGHDVTVLEASLVTSRKVGECLSPGANAMLQSLGLRDGMEDAGHLASPGNRAFWGSDSSVERDFLFGTKGEGWHIDRRRFESDLACIAKSAGVRWHTGHRVRRFHRERTGWRLDVDAPQGSRSLDSDFIVDATGRTRVLSRTLSTVHAAELPGGEPDRLLGFAGFFTAPNDLELARARLLDRFTLVEATERGWWYSALLSDDSLVAVAMTDADLLPDADPWKTYLVPGQQTQRRIREHGGQLESRPTARTAGGSRLERACGSGWLAVGDAALAFDPLSSYGITSAMGTAYYAAHAIADSLNGDPRAFPAYHALLDQTWERYLREHADHYAIEQRWPTSPFWSRRLSLERVA